MSSTILIAAELANDNNAEDKTTWTCSMHPQIKVPDFGQCPLCFMDLIPLDNTKVLPSNIMGIRR